MTYSLHEGDVLAASQGELVPFTLATTGFTWARRIQTLRRQKMEATPKFASVRSTTDLSSRLVTLRHSSLPLGMRWRTQFHVLCTGSRLYQKESFAKSLYSPSMQHAISKPSILLQKQCTVAQF